MTKPSLVSQEAGAQSESVRLAKTWAVWLGLVLPLLIALAAAVILVQWLPRTPDPIATHWSGSGGPEGFSSPALNIAFTAGMAAAMALLLGLIGVFGTGKSSVLAWSSMNRFMVALALCMATSLALMGVLLTHMQLGLDDARNAPGVGAPLVISFGIGIALGVLGYIVQPKVTVSGPIAAQPEIVPLAATERAVWLGTAGMSTPMMWVLGGVTGGMMLMAVLTWWSGTEPVVLWLMIGTAMLLMVLLALTTWFRVRIDARGLEARSVAGWPVFRVRADDVDHVVAGNINPLSDFGGWGIRWVPGRLGVVMRSGDGIVVTRTNGRIFGLTVDDAATAAALLETYAQAQRSDAGVSK